MRMKKEKEAALRKKYKKNQHSCISFLRKNKKLRKLNYNNTKGTKN